MSKNDELIKQSATEALKSLKKVIASRGRLQGNFYYAGHPKGETAGIAITLSARDPKGSKVIAQGKKLRKAIDNAKFVSGTVGVKGSKLVFTLHGGNGTRDHMKNGFKRGFEDRDFKALKALLRKALFSKPGTDEPGEALDPEADTDITAEEDSLQSELSIRERTELLELIELQGDLYTLNRQLEQSFLSELSDQDAALERIDDLTGEIERLESESPDDPDLQKMRLELAQLLYLGDDPFSGIGQELSTETATLLTLSEELTPEEASPVVAYRKALLAWRFAKNQTHDRLGTLRKEVLADFPEETSAAAKLDVILDVFSEGLGDALDAALSAESSSDRQIHVGQARGIAGRYRSFLTTSPLVKHIDANPYVDINICSRLTTALDEVTAHLS